MIFIPTKKCNPQLSRRLGNVVGYIPHQYYLEVVDSLFSGTVESWSDLPSNVQDIILKAETEKRVSMQMFDAEKQQTITRINEIKKQLDEVKSILQSEKTQKTIENNKRIKTLKNNVLYLKDIQSIQYE